MIGWIKRFFRLFTQLLKRPADMAFEPNWFGRLNNALTFMVAILFLGAWMTGFVLLEDRFSVASLSRNILTDLNCIVFFGGLALAIFISALVSNLLRRFLWKLLIARGLHEEN